MVLIHSMNVYYQQHLWPELFGCDCIYETHQIFYNL